ncbi:MAG: chemotaxis protein CheW [Pseudohongiellaceae bacterium]
MVKSTRTTDLKVSATDVALANYMDAMLHTATEADDARWPDTEEQEAHVERAPPKTELPATEPRVDEAKPTVPPAVALPQVETQSKPLTAREMAFQVAEPQPVEPLADDQPLVELSEPEPPVITAPESVAEENDLSRWLDNGRPAWAQQRFDCLVFVVDGLKLAVPLILLGNIHPLDRDLTPLFDQPEWFLGLLPVQNGRNLRVVDTARLVMPERYRPGSVDELAFGVGVYGSDWAFGCHQIEGSISLEPDAVKWRSTRTSRPWLAGTIIDRMCALVDLHEFARTAFKVRSA